MLKRFTKSGKKQNKSGVILITILFILAVAFILIGSALIMTANTRKRLYSFAEGSQARLTVTSAAQLIENALQSQELSDAKLKALCDANATVWFTDSSIPGMGGTGGTTGTSPDNCTCAKFSWNGTKPTVALTTIIDDEVENVLLTYVGTPTDTHTSPFAYQVELGEGGRLDKISVGNVAGTNTRYNADDNLVLSRGNGTAPADSCYFYSTFVTTHPMRSASGAQYFGDVIYLGPNAGVKWETGSGTGAGGQLMNGGTAYFINCNQVLYNYPGPDNTHELFDGKNHSTSQVIFVNTHDSGVAYQPFQCFTGFSNGSIYQIDYNMTNGAITPSSHSIGFGGNDPNLFIFDSSFTNSAATGKSLSYYIGNYDQWLDPEYAAPGHSTPDRPSCYSDFVTMYSDLGLTANGSISDSDSATLQGGGAVNGGGVYKVTGTVNQLYNISVGSGDVFVYLQGAITINDGCGFVVSDGNGTQSSGRCYFIISNGGSIKINSENQPTGFFSTNCHQGSKTGPLIQTQAPCIYIIGAGTNGDATLSAEEPTNRGQICCDVNQNAYIDAMIALYPFSDTSNDGGDFFCREGNSCHFYGRIIARTVRNKNGTYMSIPYCPQYSTGEDTSKLYRVYSAYTLESFDYYYDATDTTGTSSGLHE